MFYPMLSQMNQAGGGKPFPGSPTNAAASVVRNQQGFAGGGVATGNDGGALARQIGQEVLKGIRQMPAPRVGVDEISSVARRVQVRESNSDA